MKEYMNQSEIFVNAFRSVIAQMSLPEREKVLTFLKVAINQKKNGQDCRKMLALAINLALDYANEPSAKYLLLVNYEKIKESLIEQPRFCNDLDKTADLFHEFYINEDSKQRRVHSLGLIFDRPA